MTTLTLKTTRPCCGRASRFAAVIGIPKERYTRRCRDCETTWDIKRQTICDGEVRIDRLTWLDTHDREFVRTYATR